MNTNSIIYTYPIFTINNTRTYIHTFNLFLFISNSNNDNNNTSYNN